MSSSEALWTVVDVATYLKLEEDTIRKMARNGILPGVKVGKVWRFRKNQINDWLGQLQERNDEDREIP